ncbi:cytosolic 5'-nucleotidase 1A isoform X1 [Oryzias latipes]|uniref:Uncharacterized protein n=1 Tax=Oryzias latipes TaxID=8090 RepID=H2MYL3_ORYLA|nr:cytosolic 5'-nucleotidase 1A isoform X1 [Oryzias latipes]XP_011471166.1 cytosolic 5'-nucleotidase 1A isoform X1 [Oryzias latipes]
MVSVVLNTDVKQQEDAGNAVVVAVTSRALFESGLEDDDAGVWKLSLAFPLLQAVQKVNDCLLEKNPAESLLLDVLLITTDSQHQKLSSLLISSTKHHGLGVGKFCFASEETFVDSLLENNVQLFLSTNKDEVQTASQKGVPSAMLEARKKDSSVSCQREDLRVWLDEDLISLRDSASEPGSRHSPQRFLAKLGEIRQRFSVSDSPLWISLVILHGSRENCGKRLKTLRSLGVSVDDVYCLAGAPSEPLLSVLQPHFRFNCCFMD